MMHPDFPTCYELLPKVSRTFALNIRILPGELRPALPADQLEVQLARPVRGEVRREDPSEDEHDEQDERGDAERPAQIPAERAPPRPTRPDPRLLRRLEPSLHHD